MRALFAILLLVPAIVFAGDCVKTGSVCVDAAPTKTISGVTFSINEVGGCWAYEDSYTCHKPNAVNYCQPFIDSQPACWQTSSVCSQMDTTFGLGCMRYAQTWRCGDANMTTPASTVKLDSTYTLVSSNYDTTPCQALNEGSCDLAETKCTSTTPPALPPGITAAQVAPDGCFEQAKSYACLTGNKESTDCDRLANNDKCTYTGSTCEEESTVHGSCAMENRTYRCETVPATSQNVVDCSTRLLCQNGNCFETGYENDKDFGQSMATLEAMRQAGVYGSGTSIFAGEAAACSIKLGGLGNCCKTSSKGGTYSNGMVLGMGMQVAGQGLSNAYQYGSSYVYDSLMSSGQDFLAAGVGAMSKASEFAAQNLMSSNSHSAVSGFTPSMSLSLYGFTASTTGVTAAQAAAGVVELGQAGGLTFAFDPYSLMISIAIQVVMDFLACEEEEMILSMRKGQRLCVDVGSYCDSKVLGVCVTKKKASCCFNSRLARIINVQGRAQLGKSWGNPKSPDCSGFSPDEFAQLDFSQIDLSEFIAEIKSNIKLPSASGLQTQTQVNVTNRINGYYANE